jgi:chain length determinant protein (polysaccharide antigen chain regulator)
VNTVSQNPEANTRNISLSDIIKLFWKSKKLILTITLLCTCLSIGYLVVVQPTYQATTRILPPQASDLAEYVESLYTIDNGISEKNIPRELDSTHVYEIFYTNLKSVSIKNQFLSQYYLPHFSPKDELEAEQVAKRLEKSLSITGSATEGSSLNVSIKAKDPKLAAQWANDYTNLAVQATHTELLKNLQSEIIAKKQSTENRITTLRKLEKDLQDLKIGRLQDALAVAKAMELEAPMLGTTVITLDNSPSNENSFMRGTRSLQAEIDVLSKRKDQDVYIAGLPKLLTQQAVLQTLNSTPDFTVARIDMLAQPPYEPVKPIKPLVLLIGIIFGLFLGMFVVLIISAIRND